MAYPTGSGSEILYRGTIHNQSSTATAFRFDQGANTAGTSTGSDYDVPALHTITVLNIAFTDVNNDPSLIDLWINDGANDIYIFYKQPLGAYATFVWNEKIVLTAGDFLRTIVDAGANMDISYNYIDQDWT